MSCDMTYNKDKNNKQEVKQMKRSWMKKLRREHNMTQEQLAKAVGVSRTTITEIENGNANPSVAKAKKIAAVLGFNWVKFFEDDEQEAV